MAEYMPAPRTEFARSRTKRNEAGTTSMIINLVANDLNATLDRMEEFATGVMPLV